MGKNCLNVSAGKRFKGVFQKRLETSLTLLPESQGLTGIPKKKKKRTHLLQKDALNPFRCRCLLFPSKTVLLLLSVGQKCGNNVVSSSIVVNSSKAKCRKCIAGNAHMRT